MTTEVPPPPHLPTHIWALRKTHLGPFPLPLYRNLPKFAAFSVQVKNAKRWMRKVAKDIALYPSNPTLSYTRYQYTRSPARSRESTLLPPPPPPGGGGGEGDGGMESRCEESGTGPLSVDPCTPSHPLLSSLSSLFAYFAKKFASRTKLPPAIVFHIFIQPGHQRTAKVLSHRSVGIGAAKNPRKN